MLAIRPEQAAALRDAARSPFIDRLVVNVQEWFAAERVTDPAVLRARIAAAVDEALAYGFATERLAAKFVAITFSLGDGFATRFDWARRIVLHANGISAERKMRLLMDRAHETSPEDHEADA